MELWIRSQDKSIIKKCNYIRIHEIIINEEYVLEDEDIDYASYNSKERAIEVLDEIQNLINDISDFKMVGCVYEMPEEMEEIKI